MELALPSDKTIDSLRALYKALEASEIQLVIAVEGNIACGKSTFLSTVWAICPEASVHVENTKCWRDLEGHNLLDLSYNDSSKYGLAFQMLAITGLLAIDPARDESWLLALCYLVLYTAAVLTLWSMVIYLRAAWAVVKDRDNSL